MKFEPVTRGLSCSTSYSAVSEPRPRGVQVSDFLPSCVAELVGTFLLVATFGCNVLAGNEAWGAVSVASVLTICIYAFSPISGGHFNPAVSISLGWANKLNGGWKQAALYCVAQILGACLAAAILHPIFGSSGIRVGPTIGHGVGACICEIAYTFMLCFVVLNIAASKALGGSSQSFGLAIGSVIVAGGYSSAPLGAGCFNPAVAIGIFVSSFQHVGWCVAYIVAQLLGVGLAVPMFQILRREEIEQGKLSDDEKRNSNLLSEAIGTFVLVLTVGLNVLGMTEGFALSAAAALTSMIYAVGDVSGGHFNPAVTLAIFASGKGNQDIREARYYVAAQLSGGIFGAFAYTIAHRGNTFPLGPGIGYSWVDVGVLETLFTFVLTAAVLRVTFAGKTCRQEFAGYIIGACVVAGGFAAGGVSGAVLNPAVSLGVAVVDIFGGGLLWKAIPYSMFQLLGALAAAGTFRAATSTYGETPDAPIASNLRLC